MVPVWVPYILVLYDTREPKRDHNFDNHPHVVVTWPNLLIVRLPAAQWPYNRDHTQIQAQMILSARFR